MNIETHPTFTKILREICGEEKIDLQSYSDNWAFRLTKNGVSRFIVGYQFPLNSAPAKELCQDKYLTGEVLSAFGVPAVDHEIFFGAYLRDEERKAKFFERAKELIREYGAVVLKDNYGTGGLRVFRVEDESEFFPVLEKILASSHAAVMSPFYEIKEEYRVTMLSGEPKQIIRKDRAYKVNEKGEREYLDWRHNLGLGATGVLITDPGLESILHPIAKRTMEVIGAEFASVDIVNIGSDYQVLEVNGGVMMEYFAGQDDACYRQAKSIYREAVLKSFPA